MPYFPSMSAYLYNWPYHFTIWNAQSSNLCCNTLNLQNSNSNTISRWGGPSGIYTKTNERNFVRDSSLLCIFRRSNISYKTSFSYHEVSTHISNQISFESFYLWEKKRNKKKELNEWTGNRGKIKRKTWATNWKSAN